MVFGAAVEWAVECILRGFQSAFAGERGDGQPGRRKSRSISWPQQMTARASMNC